MAKAKKLDSNKQRQGKVFPAEDILEILTCDKPTFDVKRALDLINFKLGLELTPESEYAPKAAAACREYFLLDYDWVLALRNHPFETDVKTGRPTLKWVDEMKNAICPSIYITPMEESWRNRILASHGFYQRPPAVMPAHRPKLRASIEHG